MTMRTKPMERPNSSRGGSKSKNKLSASAPSRVGSDSITEVATKVKVAVRCRPPSAAEKAKGAQRVMADAENSRVVILPTPGGSENFKEYGVDWVYDERTSQEQLYEDLGAPAVDKCFEWYNSTIFAYGQTGSGKTYSILGEAEGSERRRGLIPRVVVEYMRRVQAERQDCEGEGERLVVLASYLEVYQERLVDLLVPDERPAPAAGLALPPPPDRLRICTHPQTGVHVQGATEAEVETAAQVLELIREGSARRQVAAHSMNDRSSRSHAIFTLKLVQVGADGRVARFSKLNLVDLAGSERQKETHAEGVRLLESASINKSLHTLQRVIMALQSKEDPWRGRGRKREAGAGPSEVVPFRESKLTMLLNESLGGSCFSCMLACISPADAALTQTESTLAYALGARCITQHVLRNVKVGRSDALQEEVKRLRVQLAEAQCSGASAAAVGEYEDKIAALMDVISESSKTHTQWAQAWELQRASLTAKLTLPGRVALALGAAGSGAVKQLEALERELQQEEAAYHQQRRFVLRLEGTLKRELEAAAAASEEGVEERQLEGVLVRLRCAQDEGRSMKDRKKRIADLYRRMAAFLEREHLALQRPPPAPARSPAAPALPEPSWLERSDPLGKRYSAGAFGDALRAEAGPGPGAEERERERALAALGELQGWCREGLLRLKQAQHKEDHLLNSGSRGINMAALMALLEKLPKSMDDELEEIAASVATPPLSRQGSTAAGAGAGAAAGPGPMNLSGSVNAARLAWGDTKAIDCVGWAVSRLDALLVESYERRAQGLEAVHSERQRLAEDNYRLQELLRLRSQELAEVAADAAAAHDAADAAHVDTAALEAALQEARQEARAARLETEAVRAGAAAQAERLRECEAQLARERAGSEAERSEAAAAAEEAARRAAEDEQRFEQRARIKSQLDQQRIRQQVQQSPGPATPPGAAAMLPRPAGHSPPRQPEQFFAPPAGGRARASSSACVIC